MDHDGDRPLAELDDRDDRDELRRRYGMLLQELRVVLPGVQVLLAFLLTVPFASGFDRLDTVGRDLYGLSLVSSFVAVVLLLGPPVFHRSGVRTARRARLRWGIRSSVWGYGFLAVALVSGLWCVTRNVFGATPGLIAALVATTFVTTLWVVVPRLLTRSESGDDRE